MLSGKSRSAPECIAEFRLPTLDNEEPGIIRGGRVALLGTTPVGREGCRPYLDFPRQPAELGLGCHARWGRGEKAEATRCQGAQERRSSNSPVTLHVTEYCRSIPNSTLESTLEVMISERPLSPPVCLLPRCIQLGLSPKTCVNFPRPCLATQLTRDLKQGIQRE